MIRDLSKLDKIEYSKLFIDSPNRTFLKLWFLDPEGMFKDIDFYVAQTFWHEYTLKAKIAGVICGIFILPFIFVTFVLIVIVANVTGYGKDGSDDQFASNKIITAIGRIIVFLFLLFPLALIRFPFSLYSYFVFKKRALFYLLEVDSNYDTSSE